MKKLIILLLLIGCTASNRHPYRDNRSDIKPWWANPNHIDHIDPTDGVDVAPIESKSQHNG